MSSFLGLQHLAARSCKQSHKTAKLIVPSLRAADKAIKTGALSFGPRRTIHNLRILSMGIDAFAGFCSSSNATTLFLKIPSLGMEWIDV
jgi:hypothetical protein